MSKVIADRAVETLVESESAQAAKPNSALPTLKELFVPPLLINGLIVAMLLLDKHLLTALALVGGTVVGLIVFSALHFFAENIFGVLSGATAGPTSPGSANLLLFGVFAGGKFVLVGLLMYVMIAVLHLSLIAFVVGFIGTQIAVSAIVINRLTKSKVTD